MTAYIKKTIGLSLVLAMIVSVFATATTLSYAQSKPKKPNKPAVEADKGKNAYACEFASKVKEKDVSYEWEIDAINEKGKIGVIVSGYKTAKPVFHDTFDRNKKAEYKIRARVRAVRYVKAGKKTTKYKSDWSAWSKKVTIKKK